MGLFGKDLTLGPAFTAHVVSGDEQHPLVGLGLHSTYRLDDTFSLDGLAFHAQTSGGERAEDPTSEYRTTQQVRFGLSVAMRKRAH